VGRDVIDCDSHVLEPADLWQNYLEQEFVDRAIRIETKDGIESLVIGEQVVLQGVLAGLGGAHVEKSKLFMPGMKYIDGCPLASYDATARIAEMDKWGVTSTLVFPALSYGRSAVSQRLLPCVQQLDDRLQSG
jgi:uncharacterized protein